MKKECGVTEVSVIPQQSKYISSPNYPKNYDDDSTCVWKINNNNKFNLMTFQIIDMNTELDNDIVEVRNGGETGYLLGKFSGTMLPAPVFSTEDKFWVKFQSDFENNMKGFKAKIQDGMLHF